MSEGWAVYYKLENCRPSWTQKLNIVYTMMQQHAPAFDRSYLTLYSGPTASFPSVLLAATYKL